MSEILENPAQKLWQNQPVEGIKMSPQAIRLRADKFERKIVRRNVREYVSSLVASAVFVYFFATTQAILFRFAYALFIAGLGWVVFQLYRKGSARSLPADMGALNSLQFFRAELERQRDVVKNIWTWYLLPLVPGFIVLTAGSVTAHPYPYGLYTAAIMDAFVAVVFFVVWRINMRAARCLQRTIDELYAAEN